MEALHTLGIDWKVMLAQAVNFGILIFVLTKVLYKPILNALEERRKRIQDSLDKAAAIDEQNARMTEQMANQMAEARKDADTIMTEAKESGEKVRATLMLKAEEEAEHVKKSAHEQMEIERNAMMEQVQSRASKLALSMMIKTLQKDMGDDFYKAQLEGAMKDMETSLS